ncbi:hypothetical protein KM043_006289 [Ampulex compressa]|nr:hypothetical protein KM043_006289 [Ampulex compressa]
MKKTDAFDGTGAGKNPKRLRETERERKREREREIVRELGREKEKERGRVGEAERNKTLVPFTRRRALLEEALFHPFTVVTLFSLVTQTTSRYSAADCLPRGGISRGKKGRRMENSMLSAASGPFVDRHASETAFAHRTLRNSWSLEFDPEIAPFDPESRKTT